MNRALDRLGQMLTAAKLACSYVEGMERPAFLGDPRTQQAVVMNLVIIGEAASRLIQTDAALLAKHAAIKWELMRGMRNRIAHGYFETDMDVVWETVQEFLPDLLARLPEVIASAAGDDAPAER
jgi:uncharacterized protein with HEPN domain